MLSPTTGPRPATVEDLLAMESRLQTFILAAAGLDPALVNDELRQASRSEHEAAIQSRAKATVPPVEQSAPQVLGPGQPACSSGPQNQSYVSSPSSLDCCDDSAFDEGDTFPQTGPVVEEVADV